MRAEMKSPGANLMRNVTSVIIATTLVLFIAFLYVFNRTTFFSEPSIERTMKAVQPPR
jgi:hypothetical protein